MARWNHPGAPNPGARSHAGLWYDRAYGVDTAADAKEDVRKRKLVTDTCAIATPPLYTDFYARWNTALIAYGAACRTAEIKGRLTIGTGNASVIEAGLTLHHTYGTPCIPGSGIKGLASHYAADHLGPGWARGSDAHNFVFGKGSDLNPDMGHVTFFDALYIPGSAPNDKPLAEDVVTIHHQSYYNKPGQLLPPSDFDDPVIVPMLSVTGKYLLAIKGPDVWVTVTWQILAHALIELGVGAKTAAGYGRMELEGFANLWALRPTVAGAPAPASEGLWEATRTARHDFSVLTAPQHIRQQLGNMLQRWADTDDPQLKHVLATLIVNKITETDMQDSLGKSAEAYAAVVASLNEAAQ